MTTAYFRKENLIEKLVITKSFWFLIIAFFFSYPIYKSVNRELPPDLPFYGKLPEYSFLNEEGKTFGSNELKGKAYIANFAFTSSNASSHSVFKETEIIQHRLRGVLDRVGILTFSLDAKPTDLYKVARDLKAKPFVWRFVSAESSDLDNLLVNGFKIPLRTNDGYAKNLNEVAKTEKFVLVDGEGNIRGYYPIEKDSINKLMIDVGLLINRNSNK